MYSEPQLLDCTPEPVKTSTVHWDKNAVAAVVKGSRDVVVDEETRAKMEMDKMTDAFW